ncbi:MAG: PfkB family carbohydrate kinase [Candidatus Bipolaricaulota bacterium]|nr:PfkB family carbohydrate kinase [Candidatus Bipolaricaulota bacterium]MDW8127208.1 PfkB family carbohydrate kinase [Candidatus Bipolaricaulota bacterium]
MDLDVLLIGHVDKGRVVIGGKAQTFAGGAVHYGGIVLRRLGLRVGVLTRLAKSDVELLADLEREGVRLFPIFTEETTAIENVIPAQGLEQRRCFRRGFAGTFRAADLPVVSARLYYLGTIITGEIDLAFLRAVAERGPVALDAQGCARKLVGDELVTDGWEWMEEGLPLVRYLKVDDQEARALTGLFDLEKAVIELAQRGPAEVVLTYKDGVLVYAEGEIHAAPFRPRLLVGRTGRGDTCFSAYLGRRLLGDSPAQAAKFAAALTTLKLEQPGPFRAPLEEVYRLLAQD